MTDKGHLNLCVIPWIFAVLKSVTGCFFCVYVCVPDRKSVV